MRSTAYMLLAIVAEVVATSALRASDGFTRAIPAAIVIVGYGLSFYLLSLTLRALPVGVVYAVWSSAGIVLITVVAGRRRVALQADARLARHVRHGPHRRGSGGAQRVLEDERALTARVSACVYL